MTVTIDRKIKSLPESLKRYKVKVLNGQKLKFSFPPSSINSGEILKAIQDINLNIIDVTTRETELEDIFLKLTSLPASENL